MDDGYEPDEDEFDDEYDPQPDCWQCHGDGWGVAGEDWCLRDIDVPGEIQRCPNCRGSGLAKDCWYC